ncbi:aminodeoxychorismate lyase [Luteibacter sp. PPL552]
MSARFSVNFVDGAAVSAADRGVAYGDGLFETLRVVEGHMPLWDRHMARLRAGCERLGLPSPDADTLRVEIGRLCHDLPDAVVRVTWTRGEGERGYALPASAKPTLVVQVAPLALDPAAYRDGIAVRLCETPLALQPALAGMKHLNRLEQVLARAEWDGTAWGEGLMCSTAGDLTCATAANLFAIFGDRWATPPVTACGVAGVARAEVLACRDVAVEVLRPDELVRADEVFLTSAVRGILPVREFAGRRWVPGPAVRALQAHWRSLGLPLPLFEGWSK